MKLRTNQQAAITAAAEAWAEGMRKVLIVMATGTGKTVCFGHVAKDVIASGKRVMVLAHRDELVRQAAARVGRIAGVVPAIEKADEFSDESGLHGKPQLVVSSIQSQHSGVAGRRRMQRFDPDDFGLIVADEAHHSTADTWMAVIAHYLQNPDCKLLGVTATPDRNDDRNLGLLFESIVYRYELPDAVTDGYLVPLRQRSVVITGLDFAKVRTKRTPDGGRDFVESELEAAMIAEKPVQQVASATIELAYDLPKGALRDLLAVDDEEDRRNRLNEILVTRRHRRALVFCVSVAHARLMADVLNRWLGSNGPLGELADSVDGETESSARRDKFRAFRSGERPFLCNCMIATEGTDLPEAEVIVVARPTKSRSLFAQIVGRGTRPLPELADFLGDMPDNAARRGAIAASAKPFCEVLDFTDNSRRHDLVTTVDLIAPLDADPELIELAKEIAEERELTPDEALVEAECQVEEERAANQLLAEAAEDELEKTEELHAPWRRALVGAADYRVSDGNGYGGHTGGNVTGVARGGATDKQVDLLVKLGVQRDTASGYGKRQASAVIENLKQKRCTTGQAAYLRRLGFKETEINSMNFDAASEAIEAAKSEEAA